MQNPLNRTRSQSSGKQGCRRGVPTAEQDPEPFQTSTCFCADFAGVEHTSAGTSITELSYIHGNVIEATAAKLLHGSSFPLK